LGHRGDLVALLSHDKLAFQRRAAAGDHRGKAVHEGLRVGGGEDPGIGVGRSQAVGQLEVLAKPVLPLAAEDRDVLDGVHAADGGGQCDEKDLAEVMPRGRTLAGWGVDGRSPSSRGNLEDSGCVSQAKPFCPRTTPPPKSTAFV